MPKSNANKISATSDGVAAITQYNAALSPEHAAICNVLRQELDAAFSATASRIF